MAQGIVYLIGAGPGDPGLMTVRGKSILQKADVIVYDRLIGTSILAWANPSAELIYAGKKPASHSFSQDQINRLLAEKARNGKTVVRLKGGDPFLFGRGAEEAIFLAEQGVRFEVVPGVSSAIAAPAYAGIPLTHRDMASSVAIITGHEKPEKGSSSLRWKELSQAVDTLVFLMAIENLETITGNLLRHGRSPETPCALVIKGTTARQQVLSGTLGSIAGIARDASAKPPAVLVIGNVAALRRHLAWAEKKSLWGKRVLITRPLGQATVFAEKIASLGGQPVIFPTISIIKEHDLRPLHQAFSEIGSFDWIVFTSVNAVDIFFTELAARRIDIRTLAGVHLAAIGPETRRRVESTGCMVELIPTTYSVEGLCETFGLRGLADKRILLPRAAGARPLLTEGLKRLGAQVIEIPLYRTVLPDHCDLSVIQEILNRDIDIITFTSPSSVRNFIAMIGAAEIASIAADLTVAVIGPVTAAEARSCGLPVTVEAREYTTDGLLAAIVEHLRSDVST